MGDQQRVAWLTHHWAVPDTGGGKWIPGHYKGGAEMSDAAYRASAPDFVEIIPLRPDEWEHAIGCERIVITGTDRLSEEAMFRLAEESPMVFVHHEQTETAGRMTLIENAAPFVVHTPAHLDRELRWVTPKWAEMVLSHFDTNECQEVRKEPFALWAARNHPLKGLMQAKVWAHGAGFPLVIMSQHPREQVLEFMARAEAFVHLPLAFESECRSVMEAVLSGCVVQTNRNVGITSIPGWDDKHKLRDMVDRAGQDFWQLVLEGMY
jgi:hypothetical protein